MTTPNAEVKEKLEIALATQSSQAALFGADVRCDGKNVGDGVVNTFDMSVLMWYQFKFEPYDQLPTDPTVVSTVGGRDGTPLRCMICSPG